MTAKTGNVRRPLTPSSVPSFTKALIQVPTQRHVPGALLFLLLLLVLLLLLLFILRPFAPLLVAAA